jgi:hypothetical protein
MISHAAVQGGKIVAGKIAEQIAIQAAAELLLRRILPGRYAAPVVPPQAPTDNPIGDLEVSALMTQLLEGGAAGAAGVAGVKKKLSKFNYALRAEMKKLKRSRLTSQKRFALASKRASAKLKRSRHGKGKKRK